MWVAPVVVLAHAGSNDHRWCCCRRDEAAVAVVVAVAAAVGLLVAQPWLLLAVAVAEAEGADVLEEVEQELRALSVHSPRRGCCFACAL